MTKADKTITTQDVVDALRDLGGPTTYWGIMLPAGRDPQEVLAEIHRDLTTEKEKEQ